MDTIGVNIPIEDAIGNITRIAKLEDLCRDLWLFACVTGSDGAEKAFEQRMNALGLLEGEQND